jgi:hypothetical protein
MEKKNEWREDKEGNYAPIASSPIPISPFPANRLFIFSPLAASFHTISPSLAPDVPLSHPLSSPLSFLLLIPQRGCEERPSCNGSHSFVTSASRYKITSDIAHSYNALVFALIAAVCMRMSSTTPVPC